MIRYVLSVVDLAAWAEFALLLFGAVFVAVVIKTLVADRDGDRRNAEIVLHDEGARLP